MDRPHELFDRVTEWSDLVDFVEQLALGIEAGFVRGRRRQGKSYLLRRLAEAVSGFYYQAVEEEQSQALAGFGAAIGEYLGVPGGRLAIEHSWHDELLTALGDLPTSIGNPVVVIDEFPYLLSHSPELPSLLQRFVDRNVRQRWKTPTHPVRICTLGDGGSARRHPGTARASFDGHRGPNLRLPHVR